MAVGADDMVEDVTRIGAEGVGVRGLVEDAGEPREVEGAGEAVAYITDVVANNSSNRWRLHSISCRILTSLKAATMLLTVVVARCSGARRRARD
nr:unnamed protein product [Digitaria exilis]